jgi:hypothetical protein
LLFIREVSSQPFGGGDKCRKYAIIESVWILEIMLWTSIVLRSGGFR